MIRVHGRSAVVAGHGVVRSLGLVLLATIRSTHKVAATSATENTTMVGVHEVGRLVRTLDCSCHFVTG